MRKLTLLGLMCFSIIACSNPENKANGNTDTDSMKENYDEGRPINTPPGATTMDTTHIIDSTHHDTSHVTLPHG